MRTYEVKLTTKERRMTLKTSSVQMISGVKHHILSEKNDYFDDLFPSIQQRVREEVIWELPVRVINLNSSQKDVEVFCIALIKYEIITT